MSALPISDPRWFRLMWEVCDGTATDAQYARLEAAIAESDAHCDSYLKFVALRVELVWRGNPVEPSQPWREILDEPDRPTVAPAPRRHLWKVTITPRRVAAALVSGAVYAVYLLFVSWGILQDDPAGPIDPSPPGAVAGVDDPAVGAEASSGGERVASLSPLAGARWESASGAAPAAPFGARQNTPLKLADGMVRVQMKSGALVLVAAPADWTFQGENQLALHRGKLIAHVPPQATGFTVVTPSARFVDLGTEFGVQVDDALGSRLHVFRGKVLGQSYARSGLVDPVAAPVEVPADCAMTTTSMGAFAISQVAGTDLTFAELRRTMADSSHTLMQDYVLAHWRFENATPETLGGATQNSVITDASGRGHPLDYWPGQVGPYPSSDRTPPLAMFRSGYNGGSRAFHPAAMDNSRSGVLFYESARNGPVFAFTHDFTIEGYFCTDGEQASAGPMTLLFKDLYAPSWEVVLNETEPGALALKLMGGAGKSVVCAAGGVGDARPNSANLADGRWCYFAARVRMKSGEVSLLAGREDGTVVTGAAALPHGFAFPAEQNGTEHNLFVGRRHHLSGAKRTFRGTIDEVRISCEWLDDTELQFLQK